ncbi:grifin [Melospiza georgiana]|uniref:grifin n=1 Tax=Melospiza georgiana TaxID=44398 RepID=UPI0025AD87B3|nr:grifin [Melospiza georgiana]
MQGAGFGVQAERVVSSSRPEREARRWERCQLTLGPFEALHPEGICPGWSIVVKGETCSSSGMFEINLLCDPGDQIALHFNPRLSSSRIVCNSFLNSHWGQEEVDSTFPFKAKEPFQVEIYSDQDHFHVFINENKVLQYKHRQKNLSSITKLQILDDIDISSVEITKRALY